MRVLFVNNVSNILGGTMQCTHSMCRALPDCDITVFSFGSGWNQETQEYFGNVRFVNSIRLQTFLDETEPFDLIVYHNIGESRFPRNVPDDTLQVYYLHSKSGCYRVAPNVMDHCFCVSYWLADQVKWEPGTVIWQPVTLPKGPTTPKPPGVTIGRICAPNRRKYNENLIIPYFKLAEEIGNNTDTSVRFEFVGLPKEFRMRFPPLPGILEYYPASIEARSFYHRWDILLYASGLDETYGRTVKEAQMCGCVPVVSRRAGFIEQCHSGNGYLFDGLDDCGAILERLMRNPEELRTAKEACIQYGRDEGSLKRWRNLFLEAISR